MYFVKMHSEGGLFQLIRLIFKILALAKKSAECLILQGNKPVSGTAVCADTGDMVVFEGEVSRERFRVSLD